MWLLVAEAAVVMAEEAELILQCVWWVYNETQVQDLQSASASSADH